MCSWPTTSERLLGLIRTASGRPAASSPAGTGASASGSLKSSLWSSGSIRVSGPGNLRPIPEDEKPFSCYSPKWVRPCHPTMKSAYELAMERLSKSDPASSRPITPEQRKRLADIDRVYQGKLAEREIFLKQRLEQALSGRDADEVDKIKKQIASEKGRLEEDRESEKERVRSGKA